MTIYKVYKITNRLNGKIYVGQTKQPIEKRFIQHSYADSPIGKTMRQCGIENFTIEIIEYCDSQKQLNEREIFWINALNSKIPNGYNVSGGGKCSIHKHSLKTNGKKKRGISESLKRFRKEFNLSQKSVADSLGIKPQSYVYETKGVIPSAAVIVKLATIYKVSADYLLGLTNNPSSIQNLSNENILIDSSDVLSLESRVKKLESDNEKIKSALEKLGITED